MAQIDRSTALRRGVGLEVASLAWMAVEAVVAIGAGIAARSALLAAFGVDSVIELLSAFVVLRMLMSESGGAPKEAVERMEETTVRIAAVLLVSLCAFVLLSSLAGLALRLKPEGSAVGLAVSAAALVVMPLLAWGKARANAVLDSASLWADVAESVSCAYLAAVTLAGIGVSMALGLWWVQYVAALALLIWIVPETREAIEAARGGE